MVNILPDSWVLEQVVVWEREEREEGASSWQGNYLLLGGLPCSAHHLLPRPLVLIYRGIPVRQVIKRVDGGECTMLRG